VVARLPGLLAEREPGKLVSGMAEVCRDLTGARSALAHSPELADDMAIVVVRATGR